ncbi:MAG: amidohydrolase family protein [Deltaproteobacteria bacterium]|nr:amidohydrolase family protein [Deltaproteobacteria bacterium]
MLDLRIDGGTLIDGTGQPGRKGSLGIRDGRIVALGRVDEPARETIDATGLAVCPGFVDIHTHYDAQVFWDPMLSPSSFHGVTTVVGGNCGFSIAPLTPEAGAYLMPMLARVEGMPLQSLKAGVPWSWRSFGEYLGQLEGRLAINAGFLVGHCAIRRVVMGERSVGHEATPEELAAMVSLLRQSIAEGGLGFSTTVSVTHNDAEGEAVPSRHASREELVALARVLSEMPGTSLEMIPGAGLWTEKEMQLMTDLSLAANRPLNWNLLAPNSNRPQDAWHQIKASDYAAERGARVVALTPPMTPTVRINLVSGFVFDAFPGWAPLFRLPIPQRIEKLRDPAFRKQLDEGATSDAAGVLRGLARWELVVIDQVGSPELAQHRGRLVGDIAREQGKNAFDCMIDIAIADELNTLFMPPALGNDDESWKLRAQFWTDPRALVGGSDAGAHLDMVDTFAFSTVLLGNARDRELISVEQAVSCLTDQPARLLGLRERGRLEQGWHADLVVFDPARVASGPVHVRRDLPAGAERLYADAIGIEHVIVAGTPIIRGGKETGALPGTILHSGRDTESVSLGRR